MAEQPNNYPKLHNATWPGVVGKGEGSEPCISLETMLDLTAAAEVDGVKFDGVDRLRETYQGRLPLTEAASAKGLALPLFSHMTPETFQQVVDEVLEVLG